MSREVCGIVAYYHGTFAHRKKRVRRSLSGSNPMAGSLSNRTSGRYTSSLNQRNFNTSKVEQTTDFLLLTPWWLMFPQITAREKIYRVIKGDTKTDRSQSISVFLLRVVDNNPSRTCDITGVSLENIHYEPCGAIYDPVPATTCPERKLIPHPSQVLNGVGRLEQQIM